MKRIVPVLLALGVCTLAGPLQLAAHEEPALRISELSARLGSDPAAPAALYLQRADLYRQALAWDAALADLATARRLAPGSPEVDRIGALTLYDAGRFRAALALADRFLALTDESWRAEGLFLRARIRVRLGMPLAAAGDYTLGLAALESRNEISPDPDLYLERAHALASDPARLGEAIAGLREGVERLGAVPALLERLEELERRAAPRAGGVRTRQASVAGSERKPAAMIPAAPSAPSAPAAPSVPGGLPTPRITRGPYLQLATPTTLVVRWRTDLAIGSRVRFGPATDRLDGVAQEEAPVTEHVASLRDLRPDTRYVYAVGSAAGDLQGLDGALHFVTPPAVGTAKPTRIWVLGDSGTANADAASVRDAYRAFTGARATDLWLMLGDNAYETGSDAEYQAAVFDLYPETLRTVPLWPTLGNHDAFHPEVYARIFTLPTAAEAGGAPSGTESYYAFDYANVHFVCLDSQISDRSPQGAMMTWLRADLALNRQPWTIAFWHHPPYSKGSHDSDSEINLVEMRQSALPILEQAGVDLVLSGHSHSYERSFLLDRHYGLSGTLVPGMVLDSGDGNPAHDGAYEKGLGPHLGAVYAVSGSSGQVSSLGHHPAMEVGLAILGSLVLDVEGDRLDATFLQADGRVGDRFTLHKTLPPPPPPPTTTLRFASLPAQDGFLTESRAGSGTGGAANASLAAGSALRIGDLKDGRALRTLLSFDTAALPDGAEIVAVRLDLRRGSVTGEPFQGHGRCRIELRRGPFGGTSPLAPADFSAPPTASDAGTLAPPDADGLAQGALLSTSWASIHRAGLTQLRLSFEIANDGDGRADSVGFYSGEATRPELRPQLIVTYR